LDLIKPINYFEQVSIFIFFTIMASTPEAAAAATDTLRIWVKYRNNEPVLFRMTSDLLVADLKEEVISKPLVGFGEYKGPIDIYDGEDGQPLRPDLEMSSVRLTTVLTPLFIKIPASGKVSILTT
jgi:hypothetical protein